MLNIDNFHYKPFGLDKIDDLLYLFNLDGKVISKKYILNKFKFDQNSTCKNYIGYIAYDLDNVPAAFIGGFYMTIKNQKEFLNAIQIGDVITNPKHRRKGLFVIIASNFFNYLSELNIFDLVFGFPNDNLAAAYFDKLNWLKNDKLQTFTKSLPFFNLYGLCHRFSILKPIYKIQTNIFLKLLEVNIFENLNGFSSSSTFENLKNEVFFRWKKSYSSGKTIKIRGNIYFIKFIDGIQIDILKVDNSKNLKTDFYILGLLFGVKKLTTMLSLNSMLIPNLNLAGFNKIDQDLYVGYLFLNDKNRKERFVFSISDADEF
jgi:hypothetical protein